ncbi:hypothetical protein [Photobacterium halotolerans]|uniref:Uncharacterized protein n=1 Tax=Photobacterium halotolerans TaxID=265726 RepID=A0A0F5V6L3_9GAMM|nr:hypothetical protein [Photobacterium halotolerans]KKC97830.1 hypothetical protein KY46_21780 [Photobacterium halotolerans]
MNKTAKITLGVTGLGILSLTGLYAYKLMKDPYDDEYMEKLKLIVEFREIHKIKNRFNSWSIYVDIPDEIQKENWDRPQIMPQVQFYENRKMYTMNINGTDVRLLFTGEEIGGLPEIGGLSFPARSPDGRYVVTTIQPKTFNYSCVIYDLKERQKKVMVDGRCINYDWDKNSKGVYFVGGKSWNEPFYFNVQSGLLKPLKPHTDDLGGLSYNQDLYGGLRTPDGNKFIRLVKEEVLENNQNLKKEILFELPSMSYIGNQDYFPQDCFKGIRVSINKKFFTCSDGTKNYYSFNDPKKVVSNNSEDLIIIADKWFNLDEGILSRLKVPGDNSPLESIEYLYLDKKTKSRINKYSIYITDEIIDTDFSNFFPPMPSDEIYKKALNILVNKDKK